MLHAAPPRRTRAVRGKGGEEDEEDAPRLAWCVAFSACVLCVCACCAALRVSRDASQRSGSGHTYCWGAISAESWSLSLGAWVKVPPLVGNEKNEDESKASGSD